MKLKEMCYEKLTILVANHVISICPLRNKMNLMIWKWVFDVFGFKNRSQQVWNEWGVKYGVFGKWNKEEKRVESIRWPTPLNIKGAAPFKPAGPLNFKGAARLKFIISRL